MSRRNDEQRARDAAQARARRLRRKLAAVPLHEVVDCHGGYDFGRNLERHPAIVNSKCSQRYASTGASSRQRPV